MAEVKKTRKVKKLIGEVASISMQSTIKVVITDVISHPVYKKLVSKRKNILVHNDLELVVGDKVEIEETKPKSKLVRWVVIKKLEK